MILNAFKTIMTACFGILNNSITIDNFTFSLWHVLLISILIVVIVNLVGGMLE